MPSLRALAISTGSGNASDDSFTTSGKLRVGDLTLAHDGVQFDGFNTRDSRELSEGGPAVLALFGTGSTESVLSKEAPQEDGNSRGGGSAVSKPRSSSQQSLRLSETIDWSCLKAGRIIGKGGSGSVRKMRLASTKQAFAVKRIDISDASVRHHIYREIEMMLKFGDTPSLVRCFGVRYLEGSVEIAMEYMDGGSLGDLLSREGPLPEPCIGSIALGALRGLHHLHQYQVLHRDIKPQNLLLSRTGECKLSDLGCVEQLSGEVVSSQAFVGTMQYMAPERLDGRSYSYESDIWSFGLTVLAAALGRFPFSAAKGYWGIMEAINQRATPLPPAYRYSPELIAFLTECLHSAPSRRANTELLLHHSFIARAIANPFEGEMLRDYLAEVCPPSPQPSRFSKRFSARFSTKPSGRASRASHASHASSRVASHASSRVARAARAMRNLRRSKASGLGESSAASAACSTAYGSDMEWSKHGENHFHAGRGNDDSEVEPSRRVRRQGHARQRAHDDSDTEGSRHGVRLQARENSDMDRSRPACAQHACGAMSWCDSLSPAEATLTERSKVSDRFVSDGTASVGPTRQKRNVRWLGQSKLAKQCSADDPTDASSSPKSPRGSHGARARVPAPKCDAACSASHGASHSVSHSILHALADTEDVHLSEVAPPDANRDGSRKVDAAIADAPATATAAISSSATAAISSSSTRASHSPPRKHLSRALESFTTCDASNADESFYASGPSRRLAPAARRAPTPPRVGRAASASAVQSAVEHDTAEAHAAYARIIRARSYEDFTPELEPSSHSFESYTGSESTERTTERTTGRTTGRTTDRTTDAHSTTNGHSTDLRATEGFAGELSTNRPSPVQLRTRPRPHFCTPVARCGTSPARPVPWVPGAARAPRSLLRPAPGCAPPAASAPPAGPSLPNASEPGVIGLRADLRLARVDLYMSQSQVRALNEKLDASERYVHELTRVLADAGISAPKRATTPPAAPASPVSSVSSVSPVGLASPVSPASLAANPARVPVAPREPRPRKSPLSLIRTRTSRRMNEAYVSSEGKVTDAADRASARSSVAGALRRAPTSSRLVSNLRSQISHLRTIPSRSV